MNCSILPGSTEAELRLRVGVCPSCDSMSASLGSCVHTTHPPMRLFTAMLLNFQSGPGERPLLRLFWNSVLRQHMSIILASPITEHCQQLAISSCRLSSSECQDLTISTPDIPDRLIIFKPSIPVSLGEDLHLPVNLQSHKQSIHWAVPGSSI